MNTFQNIKIATAIFVLAVIVVPFASADIIVPVDTGPVGTVLPEAFFESSFSEAGGVVFDGSILAITFQFSHPLRLDVPTGDSAAEFFTSFELLHDSDDVPVAPDDAGNLLSLVGSGGAVQVLGLDIDAFGFGSATNGIAWQGEVIDPDYVDGDLITGFTFTGLLPDSGETIVGGNLSFSFEGDIISDGLTLTAVPEPSSIVLLYSLSLIGLSRRLRC